MQGKGAASLVLRRLVPQAGSACGALPQVFASGLGASSSGSTDAASHSFALSSSRKEEQAPAAPLGLGSSALRPQVLRMANTLACAPLSSSQVLGSFASSHVRSLSTLARRGPPSVLAHGPGANTLTAFTPRPAARTYFTEGEVFGTIFQFTTNMMFWAGIVGAVAFRRNIIVMLLSAEIVMLACNMNFLFASAYLDDMTGVIMSITITTIAACETAIGLALCVAYFHMRSAIDVEALNLLK